MKLTNIKIERLRNRFIPILLILFLILTSCSSKNTQVDCKKSDTLTNYYDSSTFDTRLSRTLSCLPVEVKLILPGPESTRAIPQRLDNWLAAIDSHGGAVKVVQDPDYQPVYTSKSLNSGFIAGLIFDMVEIAKITYKKMEDNILYEPAKKYNVVLYYEEGTGGITRVVFNRR